VPPDDDERNSKKNLQQGMTENNLPLVEELSPSLQVMDAVRAFADWPCLLLFESALRREPVGRYSFLMADPVAKWQLNGPRFGFDPFASLKREWDLNRAEAIPELPPFQGGIAGLLGYELGQCWERIRSAPRDEFQLPVMAVGLYDWVIAWDHVSKRVWLVSQGWPERNPVRRRERATIRINTIKETLESRNLTPIELDRNTSSCNVPLVPKSVLTFPPQFPLAEFPDVTSTFSRDAYLRTVERVIEYIYAGDIFQANLSQRLLTPAPCGSIDLYARLRTVNPAPFAGLMQWDDWAIVSASPERFLCVTEGEVETRPIKGTRQRKRGPEADLFTRDELRQSNKDQAENVMIVDLLRNDLSRVCQPGTVRVPHLCMVESYETVQHLVSEVRGQLQPDRNIFDLFAATFPGGSITGAPKVRAMQIIAELEPTVRGPYCGSLFYVAANGKSDCNLLIRSFVNRYGWLQCNVGGGIVAQSDPAAEYEETLTKAAGMLKALKPDSERSTVYSARGRD
jgi:para-aminobenzoate synthetase component 1